MVLAIDCTCDGMIDQLAHAAENGAAIVTLDSMKYERRQMPFVFKEIYTGDIENYLSQMAKTLIQIGCGRGTEGYQELIASLEPVEVSECAMHLAILYQISESARIICGKAARNQRVNGWIRVLELLSGHQGNKEIQIQRRMGY